MADQDEHEAKPQPDSKPATPTRPRARADKAAGAKVADVEAAADTGRTKSQQARKVQQLSREVADLRRQLAAVRKQLARVAPDVSDEVHPWLRIATSFAAMFVVGRLIERLRLGSSARAVAPLVAAEVDRRLWSKRSPERSWR